MIRVEPVNETYIKVLFDDFGVEQEFAEFFSFFAPNYKFAPKFRSGMWDGRIKLYNQRNKQIYKGLLEVVFKFAKQQNYEIYVNPSLRSTTSITSDAIKDIVIRQDIKKSVTIRDYQYDAIGYALCNKRGILEAATSAGKSLIIYSIIRWYMENEMRIILIVPNLNLVKQMYNDFIDYSVDNDWETLENVHTLFSGQERVFDKPVIISTWQTLLSMMKNDRKKFAELTNCVDVLIGDEAHQLKSTEVSSVIEAFHNTEYRYGTTGTVEEGKVNQLTLTGLFGPIKKIVTAAELIEAGYATPVEIRVMVLKHPEQVRTALKGMTWDTEVNQVQACAARNKFIANLAKACSGNTLILYNQVKKHGNLIYEELKRVIPEGRKVYYIHGGVDADEREEIRRIVESDENAIILATSSLMSTGTNIPSIANLILTIPGKSSTRIRQSIGRGLRLKDGKLVTKVFDLTDDFSIKKFRNTMLNQLSERIKIYSKEQFGVKVKNIDLVY